MRLFAVSITATWLCKTLTAELAAVRRNGAQLINGQQQKQEISKKIDIACEEKQMPTANVFWRLFTRIRDIQ